MTIFLDSSALVARHMECRERATALQAMGADPEWCASSLARAEALMLVERVTDDNYWRRELRRAIYDDWQRIAVVPLDEKCLDTAVAIATEHPVRTVEALHLAAASRLPRPLTYLTFDTNQIPVAEALGFDVVSW
jgi:predicted nucleic acid-binding protein